MYTLQAITKNRKFLLPFLVFTLMCRSNTAISQSAIINNNDSLSLSYIIGEVIKNHPSIKESEEAINQANARIGAARSGYYPNVDISGSYTRIGPIPSITIPNLGSFDMASPDNYAAALNCYQVVYDFGKTDNNVKFENENKKLATVSVEQMKQKLSLIVTNNYFALVYLQAAINIKNEQLQTLKKHLEFIEKKKETGSATEYEILTTKVKIFDIETKISDLETALKTQLGILNSLLGLPENTFHTIKNDLNISFQDLPPDSLISHAYNQRDELVVSKLKTSLAEMHYNVIKAQNYPVINAFVTAGGKNGYFPDLSAVKFNYAAGLGLKIPLYDGARTKNNLLQAKSSIQSGNYETEVIRRNIANEVTENEANLLGSLKKVEQYELQVSVAMKAYSLAETSFKSGIITNLDLLDSQTALSESRLQLLKSRIDYVLSIYRLKASLGEKLY